LKEEQSVKPEIKPKSGRSIWRKQYQRRILVFIDSLSES